MNTPQLETQIIGSRWFVQNLEDRRIYIVTVRRKGVQDAFEIPIALSKTTLSTEWAALSRDATDADWDAAVRAKVMNLAQAGGLKDFSTNEPVLIGPNEVNDLLWEAKRRGLILR